MLTHARQRSKLELVRNSPVEWFSLEDQSVFWQWFDFNEDVMEVRQGSSKNLPVFLPAHLVNNFKVKCQTRCSYLF